MPEAAVGVLLLLAIAVAASRAVLDGLRIGTPASIAVLGPAAEAARLVRTRAVGARDGALPEAAGVLLLLAPIARVAVPPMWSIAADVLWWFGAGLLLRPRSLPRFVLLAVAVELPLALALAAPIVAARPGPLPAVEAPVAFLVAVGVGGLLQPWTVAARAERLGGVPRLLVGAALAAQPVAAAAIAAQLFLRTDPGPTLLVTILLSALLVLVGRRFPVLQRGRLATIALLLLLPLAAAQLGIVIALTLLAR